MVDLCPMTDCYLQPGVRYTGQCSGCEMCCTFQEDSRRQGVLCSPADPVNTLPDELRDLGSPKTFTAQLKTDYFILVLESL